MIHSRVESENVRRPGPAEGRGDSGQRVQTPAMTGMSSGDLTHSSVTLVDFILEIH